MTGENRDKAYVAVLIKVCNSKFRPRLLGERIDWGTGDNAETHVLGDAVILRYWYSICLAIERSQV